MKEWYYVDQLKQSVGPFTQIEMQELYENGIISDATMIWKQGLEGWVPLHSTDVLTKTYTEPPQFIPPVFESVQKELPMKWYKFEIYFAILLSVTLNIISAIQSLFGINYTSQGVDPSYIYDLFPGLNILDKVYGIVLLITSIGLLYCWLQMKNMKKNAWKKYLIVASCVFISSALYSFVGYFIIGNAGYGEADPMLISQGFVYLMNLGVGISLRYIYYKKRDYLFVK